MKILERIKTIGISVVFMTLFVSFIVSGLLINAVQLCLWIAVKPISPWLYRKVNYYLLASIWNQVLIIIDWSQSVINVYTDTETWLKLGQENALIILNHSNELDWLVAWVLGYQANILGNSKLFIKKAVEWIPIIGWAWKFAEIGFLERNWEKDERTMNLFFKNLIEYPDPVWLLFFPEGTRFTKEKHAVSMEFASKAGLPHLNNLLVPRTKGFFAITQKLQHNFDAIYSGTLCFNTKLGAHPSLLNVFLGRSVYGDVFLERIPFNAVPTEMEKSSKWLLKNFEQRDKLMDSYEKYGTFPISMLSGTEGGSINESIRCHHRPRSIFPLLCFSIWTYFSLPLMYSTTKWLLGDGVTSIIAGLFIFGITLFYVSSIFSCFVYLQVNQHYADKPRFILWHESSKM